MADAALDADAEPDGEEAVAVELPDVPVWATEPEPEPTPVPVPAGSEKIDPVSVVTDGEGRALFRKPVS